MKCPELGCTDGIKIRHYRDKSGKWQIEEIACDCCDGTGEVFQPSPRVLPDRPRLIKKNKKKRKKNG